MRDLRIDLWTAANEVSFESGVEWLESADRLSGFSDLLAAASGVLPRAGGFGGGRDKRRKLSESVRLLLGNERR